ncbi:MAG: MFS transporter, partial [Chitinophagaceae bacterium]|nr:MFS transporter [Chitinophagaceae bacterium]
LGLNGVMSQDCPEKFWSGSVVLIRQHRPELAAAVGNTVEWFDFAIFGYFARTIGSQFFPAVSPTLQLLGAFSVFAVGYLMRPIGSLLLGPIGDRIGRRALLQVSVSMMTLCSIGMAVLPTTAQWGGAAAWILVGLRMLQGLSVGGEFPGSVVALVERAPPARRGLYGSLTAAGASLGFVGGSLVAALVNLMLSPAAVAQWGWRVAFALGALLGLWALVLRRSPAEHSFQRGVSLTVVDHLKGLFSSAPAMLRLMGAVSLAHVCLYTVTIFEVETLSSQYPQLASQYFAITTVNQVIGIAAILLGGYLADRFNGLVIARRINLAMAGLALPALLLISTGQVFAFLLGQFLLLMPVMLYSGVYPSLLPFLFPAGMRCSSFSFSYSLIVALLGGTAPLVATWLLQSLRLDYAPALYCLLWVPPTLWALHRFKAIDGNRRQDSVS